MTIPIVCLGNCSANVCPHTFGKESIFPIGFKIQSWLFSPYILLLFCLSQTKRFQILASLVNRTLIHVLFGNFPVGLIS